MQQLEEAITEAKRFLERAKYAAVALTGDYNEARHAAAALKRSRIDLTRALARLRREL